MERVLQEHWEFVWVSNDVSFIEEGAEEEPKKYFQMRKWY